MPSLQMLSLKEPVVDEMGFVYEKDAVFHWLSGQPGAGRTPVRAPIAGEASSGIPALTRCTPQCFMACICRAPEALMTE